MTNNKIDTKYAMLRSLIEEENTFINDKEYVEEIEIEIERLRKEIIALEDK